MIDFSDHIFWLIVCGSFIASFINAAFALGGALVMLAITTSILPISAVIPMHSTLMFGSLISRCLLFRVHIHWSIVIPFAVGCLIGVATGALIYVNLPDWIVALVLSCLMLSVWLPSIKLSFKIPQPFFIVGVLHSFMSTVFGYGGIFHAVVLRTGLDKLQITATIAASLLTMGVMKMTGYAAFGFDFLPYSWIILCAIPVSFVGTLLGKRVIHHISDAMFRIIFKLLMTFFGLRLLYQGWQLY
jgi:uncharacterized membrane protein YfcA